MKKTCIFAIAAVAAVFASCTKENTTINGSTPVKLIPKTFTVTAADTKTILGENGVSMLWAEDDAISVIGVTDGNVASVHEFTITSGIGEASAEFSGEVGENETTFYAVYPFSATLKLDDSGASFSNGYITVEKALPADIKAIKGGIDSRRAVMIAKADDDGKLAFQHGVSYLKFKVATENVASITVNFGGGNIGGRPSYTYTEGSGFSLTKTQSNTNNLVIKPESGTFETDGFYYYPFFSTNKMGTVTLTYTHSNKSSVQINTGDTFKSTKPVIGTIYNLGTPPVSFSPQIHYTAPTRLAYDATSGSFDYEVVNPVEGKSVSATLTEGTWISNVSAANGTVTFDCTQNNASEATERSATITLTYEGAEDVEVTISQGVNGGAAESHVRILYDGSTELLDGVAVTTNLYFSHSSSYVTLSSSGSDGGGIANFAIPGTTLTATKSVKLDGSGHVTFTTSATLNSSVTFYYTKRKSGTGKIQITPDGGTATVYNDATYGTVNSQTVSLAKNTKYIINRNNGELLLIAAVVNETE